MAIAVFDWVIQMIDIYQMVTDRVNKALESGKIPWKRPWNILLPINLVSKKRYQGINLVLLGCTEYEQPYWCTFKQAVQLGGTIRAGEKSSTFVVFAEESPYTTKDQEGNEVIKRGFVLRYSPVFNVEQTTGIDMPEMVEVEVI